VESLGEGEVDSCVFVSRIIDWLDIDGWFRGNWSSGTVGEKNVPEPAPVTMAVAPLRSSFVIVIVV